MLGLIRDITSSSSTSDTLVTLCCALVHNNLEFACCLKFCVTDSSKIGRVQCKFANLCNNTFFIYSGTYKYDAILARLYLSMLHLRQHDLDALFLTNTYLC